MTAGRGVAETYGQARQLPAGPLRDALLGSAEAAAQDAVTNAVALAARAGDAGARHQLWEAVGFILGAYEEVAEALSVGWPWLEKRSDGRAA